MKKHIHFLLLVSGTLVFLFMMHRYTAPLVLNNDYPTVDLQTASFHTVMDVSMNGFHTTDIVKGSLKVFAAYLSFVVIIFAHRLFYKPYHAANQEVPPVPN